MSDSGKATQTKVNPKDHPVGGPAIVTEHVEGVLTVGDRVVGPVAAAGGGSADVQATRLRGERLHRPQRQAALLRIGRTQGNRHVQRVVASLRAPHSPRDAIQRDLTEEPPGDPAQLMNQIGMWAEDGSFAAWFAGHWRAALGLNPQRFIVGAGGAWTWGGGTTEHTFRPNALQPSIPRAWYEEMVELFRTRERFGTDDAAIFRVNRDSLQATIDYWAAGFDERVRSAAGEGAYGFVRNPEYRRFLSVMGLWPPEVTVPSPMYGSPYYRPRQPQGAFGWGGGELRVEGGEEQEVQEGSEPEQAEQPAQPAQRHIAVQQGAPDSSTSTVQRAIPNIAEPSAPNVSEMGPQTRDNLLGLIRTYRDGRTDANGQAVVNAMVDYLDPGTVQYRNQGDITAGSPLFRAQPSSAANEAATQERGQSLSQGEGGFAFVFQTEPATRYQVEIYSRAFLPGATPEQQLSHILGVITHEFIHIQQFRRAESGSASSSEQFSPAHIEFQAWLWQGEHASELGIEPGTPPFNQIVGNLSTNYGNLPPPDQVRYRRRFARVMFEAAFHQCQMIVGFNMPPPATSVQHLEQYFGWLSPADRSQRNERYQALRRRIREAEERAASSEEEVVQQSPTSSPPVVQRQGGGGAGGGMPGALSRAQAVRDRAKDILTTAFGSLIRVKSAKVQVLDSGALKQAFVQYHKSMGHRNPRTGETWKDEDVSSLTGTLEGFLAREQGIVYVLKSEDEVPVATMVHEMLHVNANPGFVGTYGADFDEGTTEYLTKVALTRSGVSVPSGGTYAKQVGLMTKFIDIVGEGTLMQAYFSNPDALKNMVDVIRGPGTWNLFWIRFTDKDYVGAWELLDPKGGGSWIDHKIALINGYLDGWVSDDDISMIETICSTLSAEDLRTVRNAVGSRVKELWSHGQRAQLRIILGM